MHDVSLFIKLHLFKADCFQKGPWHSTSFSIWEHLHCWYRPAAHKKTSRIQYRSHRCYNLHLHELIISLKVERRNINLNVDYTQLSASYSGIRDQKIQYMCTSLCHSSHEWGVYRVKFSSLSPSLSEFYIQCLTRWYQLTSYSPGWDL